MEAHPGFPAFLYIFHVATKVTILNAINIMYIIATIVAIPPAISVAVL